MNIIIENGLRIVFLLLFLKNGLTLLEALLIIILSSLAVNLIAVYRVKEIFFIKLKKNSIVNASNIVDVRYLLTLFLANLMLSLLINFDMIFVNYFFSQEKASIFAATAVVGKAIIYISSAITISLFPVSSASKTNSDKSIFYKSLLFVLFLNFISIFFYFLFGEFLIELLYGKQFKFSGHLLGYYALAIMPISLIFVAEHYFLAKKILVFVIVLILFIPIGIICMFIFANNLMSVIYIIAIIGYSTVLFGTFIYAIQKNKM